MSWSFKEELCNKEVANRSVSTIKFRSYPSTRRLKIFDIGVAKKMPKKICCKWRHLWSIFASSLVLSMGECLNLWRVSSWWEEWIPWFFAIGQRLWRCKLVQMRDKQVIVWDGVYVRAHQKGWCSLVCSKKRSKLCGSYWLLSWFTHLWFELRNHVKEHPWKSLYTRKKACKKELMTKLKWFSHVNGYGNLRMLCSSTIGCMVEGNNRVVA